MMPTLFTYCTPAPHSQDWRTRLATMTFTRMDCGIINLRLVPTPINLSADARKNGLQLLIQYTPSFIIIKVSMHNYRLACIYVFSTKSFGRKKIIIIPKCIDCSHIWGIELLIRIWEQNDGDWYCDSNVYCTSMSGRFPRTIEDINTFKVL